MNTYIIPICDLIEAIVWNHKELANSIADCQNKLMEEYSENYEVNFDDWNEFVKIMDEKFNIAIGEVTDIETF